MRGVEAPQLRPLGVGDIVDRVFSMYRQRALLFMALAAVPYLALFLVIGGLVLSLAAQLAWLGPFLDSLTAPNFRAPNPTFTPSSLFFLIAFAVAASLISVLFLSVQIGSLVDAAAARYLGKETTVGS